MLNLGLQNLLGSTTAGDAIAIVYVVLFAVFCVVVAALAVWLLTKYIRRAKYAESYAAKLAVYEDKVKAAEGDEEALKKLVKPVRFSFVGILVAIIGLGVLLRVLFTFLVTGYRHEINYLFDAYFGSGLLARDGVYTARIYIYSFIGLFVRLFNVNAASLTASLFVKLPLILADIGLIIILYHAAKKHINEYCGLVMAGFAAFFPPFIFASSVWGSIYSLMAVFLVLALYFMANKNYLGMFGAYTLAVLTASTALFLFPVFAVFVVYQFIKSIKYLRAYKISGFKAVWADKKSRNAIYLPLLILSFLIVSWLISLPMTLHLGGANPFMFIYFVYILPLTRATFFGFDGLNVFNLFFRNDGEMGLSLSFTVFFAVLFVVIITALVLLVYISRKNRANLIYLAGYVLLTINIYFIGATALTLVPVLGILTLALVFVRDRRMLALTFVLGLLMTLNASFVLMSAGHWNSHYITAPLIQPYLFADTGWFVANYVLSALIVVTHVFATLVLLDIAIANKRKLFADLPDASFGKSLTKFLKAK